MQYVQNVLRDFIDKKGISLNRWAKQHGLSPFSLYPLYHGKRTVNRTTAIKIVKASKGEITMHQLGFDDIK